MAIEVLLRRSIEGVGRVGEVVRVKPGYARNYLFPQAYAALVSNHSLKQIEKDKAAELVREKELGKKRELLLERLKELVLTMEERAGEDGHLYGSVGPRQVAQKLAQQGLSFTERQIRFELVRELGEYECILNLGGGVEAPIRVWIVQDAEEARAMKEEAVRREGEEAAAEAARAQIEEDSPVAD